VTYMIKAIPTTYAGVRMRSKLEATVAETLDRYKIAWTYESEGYDLGGVWYLPDFWLPDARAFLEVKGVLNESVKKTELLAERTPDGVRVFLADASHIQRWNSRSLSPRLTLLSRSPSRFGRAIEHEIFNCDVCPYRGFRAPGTKHCFKVYLAGKVYQQHGDWREELVPSIFHYEEVPSGFNWNEEDIAFVGHEHIYCGPYYRSGHADALAHKQPPDDGFHGEVSRNLVVERCFDAIVRSEVVFVWLDGESALTAHGTLIEIGFALARGKAVWIGGDTPDDLWFAKTACKRASGDTPQEAFDYAIAKMREKPAV
jgi:nucleoside 2-deoxyribosyltransferase